MFIDEGLVPQRVHATDLEIGRWKVFVRLESHWGHERRRRIWFVVIYRCNVSLVMEERRYFLLPASSIPAAFKIGASLFCSLLK